MNDRERVLLNIAVDTAGTVHDTMRRINNGWSMRFTFDRPSPQFIPTDMAKAIDMPLATGDIIRCKTNPNHSWGISEMVEYQEYGVSLLREIGGTKMLRMSNEAYDVLRFMQPSRIYTGTKHRIYRWASGKAFSERYNPDADYFKRCGGVAFEGDTLTIWCRPHIWAMERNDPQAGKLYAQPKKFTLQYSDKTRLKDIVDAMRDQGFGDDFEYAPEKPTEGQAGYATFTKADVQSGLSV